MIANAQQAAIIFLARLKVHIDLDLMGWHMAMYLSTVNAVSDRAEASIPKYWKER